MDKNTLLGAVDTARALYTLTRDPLMLSAMGRLADAVRRADAAPEGVAYQPTFMEQKIMTCIQRMDEARQVLDM